MRFKEWLREYLGVTESLVQMKEIRNAIMDAKRSSNQASIALGRVIAKLDPMYGTPEDDPARRVESDKLAEQTLLKLQAEAQARRHTLGEL